MPPPIAAISDWISALATTLSIDARSTFRILPRNGRIACVLRVARVARRAAGGVALDEEQLGVVAVARRAVGELVGHADAVERGLAPGQVARLLRGGARPGRVRRLGDDRLGRIRVLLEPAAEVLVGRAIDERADLGVAELRLGLALELRIGSRTETIAVRPSRTSSPWNAASLAFTRLRSFA